MPARTKGIFSKTNFFIDTIAIFCYLAKASERHHYPGKIFSKKDPEMRTRIKPAESALKVIKTSKGIKISYDAAAPIEITKLKSKPAKTRKSDIRVIDLPKVRAKIRK